MHIILATINSVMTVIVCFEVPALHGKNHILLNLKCFAECYCWWLLSIYTNSMSALI
jgi:hypothetical protein